MASAEAPRARSRIELIDVARGAGMLLVFLSHFLESYYLSFPEPRPQLYKIFTRISTPAFMCVSGLTLAVLFDRNRDRFGPTRERLIDRGLFLVLVGHPLFLISYYFTQEGSLGDTLRVVFVTDTIGFAVVAGALLITRLGPRARLALGLMLLATAWVTTALWNPPIPSLAWRLKDLLVGEWRDVWLSYNFPPVPWFGVYLVASAAGAVFARAHRDGNEATLPRRTVALGLALLAAAVVVHFALRALAGATSATAAHLGALDHFASPHEKLPPSPVFLLTYIGVTALLLAALMRALAGSKFGRAFAWYVLPFGRNSLPAFVMQSYVYFVAVQLLPRPPQVLLPLYFLATVIVLRAAVNLWERKQLNRFLTVGYPALFRRPAAAAAGGSDVRPVARRTPPEAPRQLS
jgi:uncharacterized membrane protein